MDIGVTMELDIDWKPYSALKSVTPWSSGWWGGERETSMASIAENELSILLASYAAVPILTIVASRGHTSHKLPQ
jgi:hypothetical protein